MPSLTRSTVGRVISSPGSAASLVPRAVPEITRISFSLYARAALPPRRTSFLSAFCGRCAGKCGTSLDFFTHYRRLQAVLWTSWPATELLFSNVPLRASLRLGGRLLRAAGENGHTQAARRRPAYASGPGKLFLAGLLNGRHRFEMGHQRAAGGPGRRPARFAAWRNRRGFSACACGNRWPSGASRPEWTSQT